MGLANVRNRLQLHYGNGFALSIRETDPRHVQVTVSLPLQMATDPGERPPNYVVG